MNAPEDYFRMTREQLDVEIESLRDAEAEARQNVAAARRGLLGVLFRQRQARLARTTTPEQRMKAIRSLQWTYEITLHDQLPERAMMAEWRGPLSVTLGRLGALLIGQRVAFGGDPHEVVGLSWQWGFARPEPEIVEPGAVLHVTLRPWPTVEEGHAL